MPMRLDWVPAILCARHTRQAVRLGDGVRVCRDSLASPPRDSRHSSSRVTTTPTRLCWTGARARVRTCKARAGTTFGEGGSAALRYGSSPLFVAGASLASCVVSSLPADTTSPAAPAMASLALRIDRYRYRYRYMAWHGAFFSFETVIDKVYLFIAWHVLAFSWQSSLSFLYFFFFGFCSRVHYCVTSDDASKMHRAKMDLFRY